jgi:hypothetical protein
MSSQGRSDVSLGDRLETPSGDYAVPTMPVVSVFELEDREDCLDVFDAAPLTFVGDVDRSVGPPGDEGEARWIKGPRTISE